MIIDSNFIASLFNLDISDIESFKTRTDDENVIYEIALKRKPLSCNYCGGPMIGHGHRTRKIDHPVLRGRNGYIKYHANRYICKHCGKTVLERNPFALPGFNSSILLIQKAMHLLANLNYNLEMISAELNISTTQLNTYIDSFITIPPMPLPESLGIDELHSKVLSRKSATYLCILIDNEHRCVYDVLDSRSKLSLSSYLSKIPRSERLRVKYVTIDMWEPYRDIARTYLPAADICVDPYHVVKHLCDDFDNLRISLMNQYDYNSNGYYLLKKWNWLLTKDNIYLDNSRVYNRRFGVYLNRRDIMTMIFEAFPILKSAYELKEYYRRFNKEASFEEANERIDSIRKRFIDANIPQYDEFIGILVNWRDEIVNSFKRPFHGNKQSNALAENVNGKIRSYLTISKGITNFVRFRKRILYALNPKIHYALTTKLHSDKRIGRSRGSYNKVHE